MTNNPSLTQQDLELIERVIYKSSDDVAVSIARSFERLEERLDGAESRIYGRLADIEDKMDKHRQDIADDVASIRGEMRDLADRSRTLDAEPC